MCFKLLKNAIAKILSNRVFFLMVFSKGFFQIQSSCRWQIWAAKMKISVFEKIENILWKGENAEYQHFLLFLQYFQRASLSKGKCAGCYQDHMIFWVISSFVTMFRPIECHHVAVFKSFLIVSNSSFGRYLLIFTILSNVSRKELLKTLLNKQIVFLK